MKHSVVVSILLGLLTSCQFFNTERISSETFYEEEVKNIDWKEVDIYPSFKECESFSEKAQQKACFQRVIASTLEQTFEESNMVVSNDLLDTLTLVCHIDSLGQLTLKELTMDTLTEKQLPSLRDQVKKSLSRLPAMAPAYKRGIPVATQVTLPIILDSKNL